mmetsp:Transcript_19217/g.27506  ORF Transcript_19217/g.27506 Transcript_19217/m.27506 type:complete len:112 (-) Transcript_19217:562-897(-)
MQKNGQGIIVTSKAIEYITLKVVILMTKDGEDLVGSMKSLVMYLALVIKVFYRLIGNIFLSKIMIHGFGVTRVLGWLALEEKELAGQICLQFNLECILVGMPVRRECIAVT